VVKLVVNALLATQVAAVAELLDVAGAAGLDRRAVLDLLAGLPVTSPAAARAGAAMLAGPAGPNFPVRLVRKDLRYLADLAGSVAAPVPVTSAVGRRYDAAAVAGRDGDDITALGRPAPSDASRDIRTGTHPDLEELSVP
jgi:3-hydroxyisobutyrate dehydrogenase